MADRRCHLLKNSTDYHDELPVLRFALLNNCMFGSMDVINSLIKSLRMPYIFTFHDKFGAEEDGKWTGLIGHLVENMTDIGAASLVSTYKPYEVIKYAPLLGYGNPVSILSGRIHSNTVNIFHIFDGFFRRIVDFFRIITNNCFTL